MLRLAFVDPRPKYKEVVLSPLQSTSEVDRCTSELLPCTSEVDRCTSELLRCTPVSTSMYFRSGAMYFRATSMYFTSGSMYFRSTSMYFGSTSWITFDQICEIEGGVWITRNAAPKASAALSYAMDTLDLPRSYIRDCSPWPSSALQYRRHDQS